MKDIISKTSSFISDNSNVVFDLDGIAIKIDVKFIKHFMGDNDVLTVIIDNQRTGKELYQVFNNWFEDERNVHFG
jgi:hypothetical protein